MSIFSWILFGLVAGIIANVIDPAPSRGGIFGAIVLGVLGAVVGGFIANMIFGIGVTGFNLSSFLVAILGSLVLLYVGRALGRGTTRADL
jgi:uncharacterized membrane protein YeaQ/YmgE (transglycosylase-associated protein family)